MNEWWINDEWLTRIPAKHNIIERFSKPDKIPPPKNDDQGSPDSIEEKIPGINIRIIIFHARGDQKISACPKIPQLNSKFPKKIQTILGKFHSSKKNGVNTSGERRIKEVPSVFNSWTAFNFWTLSPKSTLSPGKLIKKFLSREKRPRRKPRLRHPESPGPLGDFFGWKNGFHPITCAYFSRIFFSHWAGARVEARSPDFF